MEHDILAISVGFICLRLRTHGTAVARLLPQIEVLLATPAAFGV